MTAVQSSLGETREVTSCWMCQAERGFGPSRVVRVLEVQVSADFESGSIVRSPIFLILIVSGARNCLST